MAAPFDASGPGSPIAVFTRAYTATNSTLSRQHHVAPDGRFLMMKPFVESDDAESPPHINMVLNWFEELKERVPVN